MSTIPMSRRTRQCLIVYGLPFLSVGAAIASTIALIQLTNENRTPIVKQVIEAHGGTVQASSDGRGVEFCSHIALLLGE